MASQTDKKEGYTRVVRQLSGQVRKLGGKK